MVVNAPLSGELTEVHSDGVPLVLVALLTLKLVEFQQDAVRGGPLVEELCQALFCAHLFLGVLAEVLVGAAVAQKL